VASIIKLQNYTTFTLFECRKPMNSKTLASEPLTDEHILLDDNKYIADVLTEFRNLKVSKEGFSSR
jgi:hypothetical protein